LIFDINFNITVLKAMQQLGKKSIGGFAPRSKHEVNPAVILTN
jgi:hypothetical protein